MNIFVIQRERKMEDNKKDGRYSRIYEQAFDYADAPIIRVAQKEVPLPYNRTLEQAALPQVPDITAAVKEVLK